ncbi:hypothetical protein N7456_005864 [Penicillium angulare]|uniref:Major facilitator superfamily (MFS) profile domain-containing protein n=1 Tax=Penicillium angulare TaxID=116970 RepID=A0A9W9FZB8_9EURO|nr:hypothetical protein N7456_005864 [Penicillium angulare]
MTSDYQGGPRGLANGVAVDYQSPSETQLDNILPAEDKIRRKLDLILLPILGLAFFALQLDRGNIGAALTSTITQDLGITTNQLNVGTQLLSAGIVVTEIPSNILLQRFGPKKWLSFQVLAWGLVATFQAFVKSYPAYLATRLLLGLLEGGYTPGALFYLTSWYKKDEITLRVSLFYFGASFSSATSSLISAGILRLSGKNGLSGWQWIFLVEGLITIFIGLVFLLALPPKVGDGRPLISGGRWSYFTDSESRIILSRLKNDQQKTDSTKMKIIGRDVWNTVRRLNVLQHVFLSLVSATAVVGLHTYTPSIIESFGFDNITANALASVPIFASMLLLLILSILSDSTGCHGPFVLIAITWKVIGFAFLRVMPQTASKWHKYGTIAGASAMFASMHILNVSWLAVNCTSPQERSVAMALMCMASNSAGITGSQIFRTSDKPLYHRALTATCALAGASWVQTVLLIIYYFLTRPRLGTRLGYPLS